ncbi:MAG: hypothetical protein EOO27_30575 [Comamonadaceae bacterium]|nr:MAG: hypothetical protein EOO27_30575 [Comamonadaceae bacterium]
MTYWTQLRAEINTAVTEASTTLEAACEEAGVNHERFQYLLTTRPDLTDFDDLHKLARHLGVKASDWLKACETPAPVDFPAERPTSVSTTTADATDGSTMTLTDEHVIGTDEHLFIIDNREEEPISLSVPQLHALADLIKAAQATLL